MRLRELAQQLQAISLVGDPELPVVDVTHDSRAAGHGYLFVAIAGEKVDGNLFAGKALAQGAAAVASARPRPSEIQGAWIQVPNPRRALAQAAAAVHGHPSRRLRLVGITGTNGKTTTAHLVDSIIGQAEGTSAMLGTIEYRVSGEAVSAEHTTPEASDIQRMLRRALDAGCKSAVMEVSSHAIELGRADWLEFAAGVFTNLTRDHLDYHGTMERYFAAKKKLFDGSLGSIPREAVINVDDEYGKMLASQIGGSPTLTYGIDEGDVRAERCDFGAGGLVIEAATPQGPVSLRSGLVGRPHVYNVLAAAAAGLAIGFSRADIAAGIAACPRVAGRFEQVRATGCDELGIQVIVDYAHTDDALKKLLLTAREITPVPGRVILVFGCGGDRDRGKRAPMGEIAGVLADLVVVTSDNPRSEDPDAIISEIETGLAKQKRDYLRTADRRAAIFQAISLARSGDLVAIAGKGHETCQITRTGRAHFDDREVAREALLSRVSTGAGPAGSVVS